MFQSQIRQSLKSYRSRPFVFSDSRKFPCGNCLNNARLLSVSAVKFKEELQSSELVDLINKEVSTDSSVFNADILAPSAEASSLLEPTFSSLGLAHGYPSGWAQSLMEVLHIGADLTWVQTIGVATVLLRFCVFPIMVSAQKAIVNQNKHLARLSEMRH